MRSCVHAYMREHVRVCVHACMRVCVLVRMRACGHACLRASCMRAYVLAYMRAHAHMRRHACFLLSCVSCVDASMHPSRRPCVLAAMCPCVHKCVIASVHAFVREHVLQACVQAWMFACVHPCMRTLSDPGETGHDLSELRLELLRIYAPHLNEIQNIFKSRVELRSLGALILRMRGALPENTRNSPEIMKNYDL